MSERLRGMFEFRISTVTRHAGQVFQDLGDVRLRGSSSGRGWYRLGRHVHQEYWIPAENLKELNENIVGVVDIIYEFPRPSGDKDSTSA